MTDSVKTTATGTVSLTIISPPPSITTLAPIFSGTVGVPYVQTFRATGGNPPYTWAIVTGNTGGLTLDPTTGDLQGTPQTAGTFTFTVQATDRSGATATQSFSLVINAPTLSITVGSSLAGGHRRCRLQSETPGSCQRRNAALHLVPDCRIGSRTQLRSPEPDAQRHTIDSRNVQLDHSGRRFGQPHHNPIAQPDREPGIPFHHDRPPITGCQVEPAVHAVDRRFRRPAALSVVHEWPACRSHHQFHHRADHRHTHRRRKLRHCHHRQGLHAGELLRPLHSHGELAFGTGSYHLRSARHRRAGATVHLADPNRFRLTRLQFPGRRFSASLRIPDQPTGRFSFPQAAPPPLSIFPSAAPPPARRSQSRPAPCPAPST